MSGEENLRAANEEIVRQAIAAINAADAEALAALSAPNGEMWARRSREQGPYVGKQGAHDYIADNRATFAVFEVRPESIRALDDERVQVRGTVFVQMEGGGGGEVLTNMFCRVRNGLIVESRESTFGP